MANILKERYPGEYQKNLDRKKANRLKAAQAREEQRQRLLAKSGTRKVDKPGNMTELTELANHRAKAINGVQIGRHFERNN